MNLSINGQSQVPPGFRFHPTEEELLHYYLRKKVAYEKIDLDVIREVDLNKLEPWDIQEKCRIGSTPQNDWYFFSHKDKKYPTGTRTNRATAAGFWKATGRDKIIYSGFKRIGLRKTLVFYKGRAPHGLKSDWIMHEYRLDDTNIDSNVGGQIGESMTEDGWVVCRVFKKKNYQKTLESSKSSSPPPQPQQSLLMNSKSPSSQTHQQFISNNDIVMDQILHYMQRTPPTTPCKLETINNNSSTSPLMINNNDHHHNQHQRFMHLPRLESPTIFDHNHNHMFKSIDDILTETEPVLKSDWVTLDRLVASQLNGQVIDTTKSTLFSDSNTDFNLEDNHNQLQFQQDTDLWSFTKSRSSPSLSDPLCHLSV